MEKIIAILVAGVLTENFLLTKFLGVCPFLGVTDKFKSSLGMGVAVMSTMIIATLVTYPIYAAVLVPLNITFMSTIAFILVIALIVQFIEFVLRKHLPKLYESLGVYLKLTTTNCAILGVTIVNVNKADFNFGYALFNAFCVGLGFLLVLLAFSGIRERLESSNVPPEFKGSPITLISAAIMSLTLIGFGGLGG